MWYAFKMIKSFSNITTYILVVVIIILLGVIAYLQLSSGLVHTSGSDVNLVEQTLLCGQLYELKKEDYWGQQIGQNQYIFNEDLRACLAANIYYDPYTSDLFRMVINMTNDETLLYYLQDRTAATARGCEQMWVSLRYIDGEEEISRSECDDPMMELRAEASDVINELGFNMRLY